MSNVAGRDGVADKLSTNDAHQERARPGASAMSMYFLYKSAT